LEAQEESRSEIAERFMVSLSFVEKLWHRWQTTGSCAARPHAGGPQRRLREHTAVVQQAVAERPDATLEEVRDHLEQGTGLHVSLATICRELQRLRLPLKKSPSTPRSATLPASSGYGRNAVRS
jgi:putative transposase